MFSHSAQDLRASLVSIKQNLVSLSLVYSLLFSISASASVSLDTETLVTDKAIFFNGNQVKGSYSKNNPEGYDYIFGDALSPHGDCIKVYKHFVFMTWYQGGKDNRHVMLSRLNTKTGVLKTIQFPHRHTGFRGKWWLGETHNTIAVGISPADDTIHLLYDMHRNGRVEAFSSDYLRYSFSIEGAASAPDEDFALPLFVNSPAGHYKHLEFSGIEDVDTTKLLTYPAFFTGDNGDLFMKMRYGFSANGKMLFARYDGKKWQGYNDFNRVLASEHGSEYNWGLYGDFKYTGGKFRIAFQRRSKNTSDKYLYQNGIYYAYSDDPQGVLNWKNAQDAPIEIPLAISEQIQIEEPGDWAKTQKKNQVSIVHGFDFTVTNSGDEHFVSKVEDLEFNEQINLHTFRKAGQKDFTTVRIPFGGQLFSNGDDVYLTGLKNGRVVIAKAKGKAENFTTIYEHSEGPHFDKAVVFFKDSKAYYYLKKAEGSGDKRSLFLQIFSLK
ncbi:BNR-4 repeat-containing protein [Alteromonas sp. BMJM2]|uniref:BNR-4 repeat-containing protein n=1 Tax=Alteromonas sp. BMJM2 TaxID=2954241 RepID=UPI0022B326EE|nr:BNR-4 repeat-containing protein [Alteromonas sp. BMJM2]